MVALKIFSILVAATERKLFYLHVLVLIGQNMISKVTFPPSEFLQFSVVPKSFQLRDYFQRYLVISFLLHAGEKNRIFRK